MKSKSSDPDPIDIIEAEFGKALGADELAYKEKVTLFIAHKDMNGNNVTDIEHWIRKAETVLSTIGGGATTLKVRGAWLGNRQEPLHEDTTIVYSYAAPEAILTSVKALRSFLYEYGRETNQGEVAILLENPDGDWFFRIPRSKYVNDDA